MTDLLDKLQHATEGSRELGDAVLLGCGWRKTLIGHFYGPMYQWSSADGKQSYGEDKRPDPTRNLQAVVSLAMESGATSISLRWNSGLMAKALIGFPWDDGVPFAGSGYTLPLACSEAIIKASSKAEAA